MAHQPTPPDRNASTAVRLRLDLATHTAEVLGQSDEAKAVAAELKGRLGALVEAQDRGDTEALADAISRVNDVLDRVEIQWAHGEPR